MRISIPSDLELAPIPLPRTPTTTRLQTLPLQELTWENFEKLCLRVARQEANVSECIMYGTRGQEQSGIDFIGYPRNTDQSKLYCYQCKNVATFGPDDIESAVDKFLNGEWAEKTRRFFLCVRVPLNSTKQVTKLVEQRARLTQRHIEFEVWDGGEAGALMERLKQTAALVDDFFGRTWVSSFNGEEATRALGDRLDGSDATELRGRLGALYDTLFSRHDPGACLVPGMLVPHLSRYIVPDIIERNERRPPLNTALAEIRPLPDSGTEGADQDQLLRRREMPARLAFDLETRYSALGWIASERKAVVLGDPGMGKSSFLRFIALALLHQDIRFPELTRTWGDCFPVWISFGAWTEEIAKDNSVSIEDFVAAWLHRNSADDLKPLFLRALRDNRLLLLIDGLDEGIDEANSRKALDRLHAFLSHKEVPVVLTSRPRGFDRMQITDEWAIARLADLSDEQVRDLSRNWYRQLAACRTYPTEIA